jgi:hypothetical protein
MPADPKRDSQMRNQTSSPGIFDLAGSFRWKINGGIRSYEGFASAKLAEKPCKLRWKWACWRRFEPFNSRRRQNNKRPVLPEFAKRAALKP